MNIFDFDDKAASGCQIPHWSLACFEAQDFPEPISRTREGEVFWPGLLLATRTSFPFDPTLVVPVSHCLRGRQIMLKAAKSYLTKQVSMVGNRNESL
jgi:hypothetical protein